VKPVLNVDCRITSSKCDEALASVMNGTCEQLPVFKCTECDKEYPNEFGLSKHQRVHYFERPYVCKKCPQRFKSSADLKEHICDVPLDECSFLSHPTAQEVMRTVVAQTVPTSEAVEKTLKAS